MSPVLAQQTTPSTANVVSPQDLAKSIHNPFEDFVKVPFQSTTGFDVGPRHNAGEGLNVEPEIPFSVNSNWDLIARPSVTAVYVPSPHEQYGLQDFQTSFYLTPDWATEWLWGVGPIFQFPTATSKELGTGHWSAGPTRALIYSNGPWFNGVLAYHLMSLKDSTMTCEAWVLPRSDLPSRIGLCDEAMSSQLLPENSQLSHSEREPD